MYLKRYHDVELSRSGLWRILKQLNMSRLPLPAVPTARPTPETLYLKIGRAHV